MDNAIKHKTIIVQLKSIFGNTQWFLSLTYHTFEESHLGKCLIQFWKQQAEQAEESNSKSCKLMFTRNNVEYDNYKYKTEYEYFWREVRLKVRDNFRSKLDQCIKHTEKDKD